MWLPGSDAVGFSPEGQRLKQIITAILSLRSPEIIGFRHDGTLAHVRFLARTPWVQVHIQGTGVGEGGATYDPANFVSSAEVDCRASRLQDVSVAEARAFVFLVPVEYDAGGNKVLYDGQGGRPDYMSFVDITGA